MTIKNISDFTENQFIDFVRRIKEADFPTEAEHDDAIYQFGQLTEHPDGWDLIYYPASGADNSAEGVTKAVKEWRAKNGKSGFKQG
ncbi:MULTISPECIES: bacteriocin immunity protein [Serratia]|uniref:bacteriocin immunity protein n=1 Tax=Serratia TaxID=613 RepID=UPI000F7F7F6F|nr:bacteriocin immunity protein [Serratia marcescens]MBI6133075.1 bacteriocin immunity protein [Serratia marcescens]MCA4110959.1 bacteriocin immunity protein [Serratia marcescens]MDN0027232.1 bacteriocin immunity protein [Serratia marcescens]NSM20588.1 bacteriocin immunity protein [Serratia marcescens]NSM47855.1 bacteriocin immunity protein [Serratia marcescens]